MKKIYISLPITGQDWNDQRNHAYNVSVDLGSKGYEAVTPFDVVKKVTTPYNEAMGKCVEALLECDAIYMCRGWKESKGCRAELQVAMAYGKDVLVE